MHKYAKRDKIYHEVQELRTVSLAGNGRTDSHSGL